MRPIKEEQQLQARNLFFQTDLNRAQIAEQVGVSEKAIYLWSKAGDWRRLKSANRLMPSLMVEHFYSQIQELNENIYHRAPGKRFPTVQEAEVFRKMVLTAERLKKTQTRGEYSEMLQKFMEWMIPQNEEHLKLFTDYADRFMRQSAVRGFHPYDIEYGSEEPESSLMASLRGTKQSRHSSVSADGASDNENDEVINELREKELTGTPSPLPKSDKPEITRTPSSLLTSDKQVITGNNSNQPYDLKTNDLYQAPHNEEEITQSGNNPIQPSLPAHPTDGRSSGEIISEVQKKEQTQNEISIGYLGLQQDINPHGLKVIEYKPDDTIQKFSIGDAIYYIKKRE